MPQASPYRLLFFEANCLERWEALEAPSDLEAIGRAATLAGAAHAELWLNGSRLAVFRPRRSRQLRPE